MMRLNFACGPYDRMQALVNGLVETPGIDLSFQTFDAPRAIFDRMATALEFDVSEFSISEYVQRFAHGQCPYVAIPAFLSRSFRHGFVAVRGDIEKPQDLAGRRIGVPLYTMTAAVFIRGMLENDLGVDLSGVQWVQAAMNEPGSHGHPDILPLLRQVDVTPAPADRSLSDLIEAGEIDATIGSSVPTAALRNDPAVRRLFPDYAADERDYYRRTRIFPIMHCVVIRRDLYEAEPWIAKVIYTALEESRQHALAGMQNVRALRYMLPWLPRDLEEIDDVFGGDPWPYGVEANRPTLEALVTYLFQQGFIPAPVSIDDLFVGE